MAAERRIEKWLFEEVFDFSSTGSNENSSVADGSVYSSVIYVRGRVRSILISNQVRLECPPRHDFGHSSILILHRNQEVEAEKETLKLFYIN